MVFTVTVDFRLKVFPQHHLSQLVESLNTSDPSHADLTLTNGQPNTQASLHSSLVCSLSPFLRSMISSSRSSTTILLPEARSLSFILVRQLLYTGQCQGTRKQVDGATEILAMLGVDIDNPEVSAISPAPTVPQDVSDAQITIVPKTNLAPRTSIILVSEDIVVSPMFFPCNQCEYRTKQKGNLKRHVKAKHSGSLNLSTEIELSDEDLDSKRSNPTDDTGSDELNTATPKMLSKPLVFTPLMPASTPVAPSGVGFVKPNLNKRRAKTSKKEGNFPCAKCVYIATQKGHLKRHAELKHSTDKIICSQCGYQAANLKLMRKHEMRVHDGIKYSCDQCNYETPEKTNLAYHTKVTHEKVRYECKECGAKFTKNSSLKNHMKFKH